MPPTPDAARPPIARRRRCRQALALAAGATVTAVVAVALAGCGGSGSVDGAASGATVTALTAADVADEPVVKQILAEDTAPPGAPGRTLTLIRYTIAPGATLAPHVHPGVQMAAIDSGTLTYTVVSGTAEVRRSGGLTSQVTGPATITLDSGDAVVEPFDMVHYGANDTDQPVIITATLLTESDQGLSVAVSTTTTVAP